MGGVKRELYTLDFPAFFSIIVTYDTLYKHIFACASRCVCDCACVSECERTVWQQWPRAEVTWLIDTSHTEGQGFYTQELRRRG